MLCSDEEGALERQMRALDGRTREGRLYERLDDGVVACHACAHRCRILPGRRGVCQMRRNEGGRLMVPRDYVAGLAVDPIEKKPVYHCLPGTECLSFGMLGCSLRCDFCQNWISSQALRDSRAEARLEPIAAEEIVAAATRQGAPTMASTYNEPLITSEWAHEVFSLAKAEGIRTIYVSNGYGTRETLAFLRPVLDVFQSDLKAFREESYRALGGRLGPVLETIETAAEMGYWVELVTLVIPGFNNSREELSDMAKFIAGVSRNIPWHVTAFRPAYKATTGEGATTVADIERAVETGREAGLRFVYPGNLRGALGELENTRCPSCGETLVRRSGFWMEDCRIGADGKCPDCGAGIPGVWG